MTWEEELEGICVALDALLTAIREDDEKRRGDHGTGRSANDIAAELTATPAAAAALRLAKSPVGWALRHAVTDLGRRLDEIGGFDAMQAAMSTVAQGADERWREGMLDRRWDGIGEWRS